MATQSYAEREKTRKIRTAFGVVAAILSFVAIAAQSNNDKEPTPAAVTSMTATAQGQITDVAGDVGHRRYEVAFNDSRRNRHTVTTSANGADEYMRGDFVEISYDPNNPDGGCKIKRATVKVDSLIDQAEGGSSSTTGSGSSSGSASSSGSTMAQRWLNQEHDEDDKDRDTISEIIDMGRKNR